MQGTNFIMSSGRVTFNFVLYLSPCVLEHATSTISVNPYQVYRLSLCTYHVDWLV